MRFISFILILFSAYASCGQEYYCPIPAGTKANSASSNYVFVSSVAAAAATPYTSVTTGTVSVTGANLIVIIITTYRGAATFPIPAPTDNQGNTYTRITSTNAGGGPAIDIFYCYSPVVSASQTFTSPVNATSFPSIIAYAFSGAASSPSDQFNSNNSTTLAGAATLQTGSVTPSTNGQLLITGLNAFLATATPTINSGFGTPIFISSTVPGQTYSTAASFLIQTTAITENPTWSFTPLGAQAATVIVTFK